MNVEKIMADLKENYVWTSDGQDIPALKPCMFCGGEARIIVRRPLYGFSGAWARCRSCGACGPSASTCATILTPGKLSTPMLPESLERGIMAAVDTWNSRSVCSTYLGDMMIEVSGA